MSGNSILLKETRGYYRCIYVSTWDAPCFLELTPAEKLCFLCLRTTPEGNIPGIFRLHREALCSQTGLSPRATNRCLAVLAEKNFIEFDETVVWVKDGLASDPNISLSNPKHLLSIKKTIKSLPHSEIVGHFLKHYFDTLSDRVSSTLPDRVSSTLPDRVSSTLPDTREQRTKSRNQKTKIKKKEREEAKNKNPLSPIGDPVSQKIKKLKISKEAVQKKINDEYEKALPFLKEKYPGRDYELELKLMLDWADRELSKARKRVEGDLVLFFENWMRKAKAAKPWETAAAEPDKPLDMHCKKCHKWSNGIYPGGLCKACYES